MSADLRDALRATAPEPSQPPRIDEAYRRGRRLRRGRQLGMTSVAAIAVLGVVLAAGSFSRPEPTILDQPPTVTPTVDPSVDPTDATDAPVDRAAMVWTDIRGAEVEHTAYVIAREGDQAASPCCLDVLGPSLFVGGPGPDTVIEAYDLRTGAPGPIVTLPADETLLDVRAGHDERLYVLTGRTDGAQRLRWYRPAGTSGTAARTLDLQGESVIGKVTRLEPRLLAGRDGLYAWRAGGATEPLRIITWGADAVAVVPATLRTFGAVLSFDFEVVPGHTDLSVTSPTGERFATRLTGLPGMVELDGTYPPRPEWQPDVGTVIPVVRFENRSEMIQVFEAVLVRFAPDGQASVIRAVTEHRSYPAYHRVAADGTVTLVSWYDDELLVDRYRWR